MLFIQDWVRNPIVFSPCCSKVNNALKLANVMAEELTYRQERFVWHGAAYWQRLRTPWCLVTTLRGINISRSGLLAEGEEQALTDFFTGSETVLQLNDADCCAVVDALWVRQQGQQVAFCFTAPNKELAQLLAQIKEGAQ